MSKPLTESVLRRLTSEAFVTYLGQADQFECTLRPGCCSVTTGEPVADLNYIVGGHGATESGAFGAACTTFISKSLPFLAILFPGAGRGAAQTAADLGLVRVVDFPFMVREDAPIDPEGNDSVVVRRAIGPAAAEANVQVLSSGFGMPEDAGRRVLPASLVDAQNVDVFLASIEDDVVGTVTRATRPASGRWRRTVRGSAPASVGGCCQRHYPRRERRALAASSLARRRPAIASTRAWASRPASSRQSGPRAKPIRPRVRTPQA